MPTVAVARRECAWKRSRVARSSRRTGKRFVPDARLGSASVTEQRQNLARIVFAILLVCGLLAVSLWILLPFAAAIVWATTIVVATWPVLLKLERWFGGRRGLATTVLTLALVVIVVVPFLTALGAVVVNHDAIAERFEQLKTMEVPPPPGWVER